MALAEQKEGKLTGFQRAALGPDRSFRVECPEIQRTTGSQTGFLEGFVVLKSPDPLNVVAVYSAAGQSGFVETLHVQAVPGIRVPLKLADLVPEGRCDLTVTVRNVGAADAAASITTLDLGSGRIFNLPTPAIPAGGSVSLPAPTSRPSSDFGFTVTADSGAAVPESNESNNKAVVNCIG